MKTKSITVADLLAEANVENVCDIMHKKLGLTEETSDTFRDYYGHCVRELFKLKPEKSEQIIYIGKHADKERIVVSHRAV